MGKPSQNVSMTDIAQHLNISQATVSYVLSGRASGSVSERTRERVVEAAQQMGYRRNRAAQALAGHGSHIIELCVNGFYPGYYAHVLEAFDAEFLPTPYELHIVNVNSVNQEHPMTSSGVWPVDGVIADPILSDEMLSSFIQRGIPLVSVGPYANRSVDHVFVDLTPALLEGLRHIATQSRRVAFVALWPVYLSKTTHEGDPRYRIYEQVMEEMGLCEEVIVATELDSQPVRPSTRQIVREYIAQNGCPDAFFCFNDERAIATLAALRDLGFRVPHDVQILGCDGTEESGYHHPSISTIQYPFEEVARLSWQFLQHRIKDPDVPLQSATLTPQLLLRESTHQ